MDMPFTIRNPTPTMWNSTPTSKWTLTFIFSESRHPLWTLTFASSESQCPILIVFRLSFQQKFCIQCNLDADYHTVDAGVQTKLGAYFQRFGGLSSGIPPPVHRSEAQWKIASKLNLTGILKTLND